MYISDIILAINIGGMYMSDLRVKFFPNPDLSAGYQLSKSERILENLDQHKDLNDINDAIELHNVKKWIDSGDALTSWTDSQKENYANLSKTLIPQKLGIFCHKINDSNVIDFINNLSFQYYDDFWSLVESYKIHKKISSKKFKEIMNLKRVNIRSILTSKELVLYYDDVITEKIKSSCEYATLLISNYLEYHDELWKSLYFPKSLTDSDKIKIVNDYIDSDNPNLNIIELISQSQSSKELPLPDSTLHSAKKKHEEQTKLFFEKTEGIKMPIEVIFDNELEDVHLEYINNGISGKYPLSWITKNLDYPTVLNNFIYLFEFTDAQFRCSFVGGKYQDSLSEKLFSIKGKREYPADLVYKQFDIFFLILIIQYDNVLKKNNIDLLETFKWFFEKYLLEEFNIPNFEFDIPSKHTTYLEKCKLLAISIERALKQFSMLVKNGVIDHELLSISSNPVVYKDIPSFINDKYIYNSKKSLDYVYNSMFSHQSILLIDSEKSDEYNSFFAFLENVNVKIDEFNLGRQLMDRLINENFININSQGYLKPNDKKLLFIKDLFDNGVSCFHYLIRYKNEISELIENDKIKFESTLFSIPEQQYLNYLFNRAEFSNGLDLRNKYVHGSHSPASMEAEHRTNYYIFLRTLAFIVIKINEEFCLKERLENKELTN